MNEQQDFKVLARAIRMLQRERKNGALKNLREARFKNFIREILWAATEDKLHEKKGKVVTRKFKGQPFWSSKALTQFTKTNSTKGLQHEHVIPKAEMINAINGMSTQKNIERLLSLAIAAVVTKDQHDALNKSKKNGASRYQDKKIKVKEVTWDGNTIMKSQPVKRDFYRRSIKSALVITILCLSVASESQIRSWKSQDLFSETSLGQKLSLDKSFAPKTDGNVGFFNSHLRSILKYYTRKQDAAKLKQYDLEEIAYGFKGEVFSAIIIRTYQDAKLVKLFQSNFGKETVLNLMYHWTTPKFSVIVDKNTPETVVYLLSTEISGRQNLISVREKETKSNEANEAERAQIKRSTDSLISAIDQKSNRNPNAPSWMQRTDSSKEQMSESSNTIYSNPQSLKNGCFCKNFKLQGKVKIVNSFPDLKVQVVKNFPDLKVKVVKFNAQKCGEWQFVDYGEDFKVQFVDNFPDIKIEYVESFPGVP